MIKTDAVSSHSTSKLTSKKGLEDFREFKPVNISQEGSHVYNKSIRSSVNPVFCLILTTDLSLLLLLINQGILMRNVCACVCNELNFKLFMP